MSTGTVGERVEVTLVMIGFSAVCGWVTSGASHDGRLCMIL